MKVPERERDGMGPGDANFGEELEGSSVSRSETECSGGASPKFAASSVGGLASGGAAPDPEVTDKPKRRRFTVEYKLLAAQEGRCLPSPAGKGRSAVASRGRVFVHAVAMAPSEGGRDAVSAEAKKARPQNPRG